MALNDIIFYRSDGGLGRELPSEDSISALVIQAMEITGELEYNVPRKFTSLREVEEIGLDEDYDTIFGSPVYRHIKDFYSQVPNAELWLLIQNPNSAPPSMIDWTGDAGNMLRMAQGKIKQLAVIPNPASGYDYSAEAKQHTLELIARCQALAFQAREYEHMPLVCIVSAIYPHPSIWGTYPSGYPDLKTLSTPAPFVSLHISGVEDIDEKHCNTGLVLGLVAKAKVNECVAWVEKFPVFFGKDSATLLGLPVEQLLSSTLNGLNDFHYLFFKRHVGIDGYYLNDSHTCTANNSDYRYIENNRTINKAERVTRKVLLPKLNSPILVNPENGKLAPEVVKEFELLVAKEMEKMQRENELSGFKVTIDPNQNILANNRLQVQLKLIPTGTARMIEVFIGFENPFNA